VTASPEEIDRIAALARLRFEPEEKEEMIHDIGGILSYVEQLKSVDVEGTIGAAVGVDWPAPERTPDHRPDPLMHPPSEQAPDWRDGFFVVPKLAALDRGSEGEER